MPRSGFDLKIPATTTAPAMPALAPSTRLRTLIPGGRASNNPMTINTRTNGYDVSFVNAAASAASASVRGLAQQSERAVAPVRSAAASISPHVHSAYAMNGPVTSTRVTSGANGTAADAAARPRRTRGRPRMTRESRNRVFPTGHIDRVRSNWKNGIDQILRQRGRNDMAELAARGLWSMPQARYGPPCRRHPSKT